jgi:acetoin utilization deacetylase AcuC-like enzyme
MPKEIPVVYNPSNSKHKPQYEYFNCEARVNQDSASRVSSILNKLKESRIADIQVSNIDDARPHILRIHSLDYLNFLYESSLSAQKIALDTKKPRAAIYPSVHPYVDYGRASNFISRRGQHIFDTYTPIMSGTHEAAVDSAGVAIAGAILLKNGEELVYSLNRPSGHHAEVSMAGGMCYLNNAAIAAQYLLDHDTNRVAIFDIDLHHGNGTQDIFYKRGDVLVVNINANPNFKFPHFTGYEDERGQEEGLGANYNFPLPQDTNDYLYDQTVKKALQIIKKYQPEYLLISAGFDTHERDPIGAFKLTTPYYQKIGRQIKNLGIPTLVIQEGGYATKVLGENVLSLLTGLQGRK